VLLKFIVQQDIKYLTSLTKNEELHLFRVIQELLNNSIRHGQASKVSLELMDSVDSMSLVYTDNGKGFLVKQALSECGLGLTNIKSRAAILNGNLKIKSQLGNGAVFTIAIKHNNHE